MIVFYGLLAIAVVGFCCGAAGMLRIMARSGNELWIGMAEAMSMSRAEKDRRLFALWNAFNDPKHPADRWLMIGGMAVFMGIVLGIIVIVVSGLAPMVFPGTHYAS